MLTPLREVLVCLDRVLVRSQSNDLPELGAHRSDVCGGKHVERGVGEDLGQELGVNLLQLPATLESAEIAGCVRPRDVAILQEHERRLGSGALGDQVVDERQFECRGDQQESLGVAEVRVEPVVREGQCERIDSGERVGLVEEHASNRSEGGLDLVVEVFARLSNPLVVPRVSCAGDTRGVCVERPHGVPRVTSDQLAGHVSLDTREQTVLVVIAQNRGLHLPRGVLLRKILDRRVAQLLIENREAEGPVTRHRVLAPLDRRDAVLPLVSELGP